MDILIVTIVTEGYLAGQHSVTTHILCHSNLFSIIGIAVIDWPRISFDPQIQNQKEAGLREVRLKPSVCRMCSSVPTHLLPAVSDILNMRRRHYTKSTRPPNIWRTKSCVGPIRVLVADTGCKSCDLWRQEGSGTPSPRLFWRTRYRHDAGHYSWPRRNKKIHWRRWETKVIPGTFGVTWLDCCPVDTTLIKYTFWARISKMEKEAQ